MAKVIANEIFSLSGASIAIGTAGFLSALVGMFVDVNVLVSTKWLIFISWISITLMVVLLKIIYDLLKTDKPPLPFENPIQFIQEEKIFVIRKNENFINSIIVGCYARRDEVDRLAYLGAVHLVQDTVIQIRIIKDMGVLPVFPTLKEEFKNIEIRAVVPLDAIESFNSEVNHGQ